MGFIETSYGSNPNLSQVNIDSNLNMDTFGISAGGAVSFSGGLDLNDTDLIGVKRFICNDFMGAIKATASDNIQKTLILNDITTAVSGDQDMPKKFRIPSNFVAGSNAKVKVTVCNPGSSPFAVNIFKYDPVTFARVTSLVYYGLSANFAKQEISLTLPNTINAGDICGFVADYTAQIFGESEGVKLCYDYEVISDSVWEVITP